MIERLMPALLAGLFFAPPSPTPVLLTHPPEVTSESEEDFHDLVFFLPSAPRLADGSRALRASAVHRGRPIEVEVRLGPRWTSGSLGKDIPLITYKGVVVYRSTGPRSNAFLRSLDQIYGTHL